MTKRMELIDYTALFWRRKAIILLVTIIVMLSTTIVTLYLPKTYRATTLLQVGGGESFSVAGYTPSSRQINVAMFSELTTTPNFKEEVWRKASKGSSFIGNFNISAQPIRDTDLIEISVESHNPHRARTLTNAAAKLLIDKSEKLNSQTAKLINERVQRQQVKIVDAQLAELRRKALVLKNGPTASTELDKEIELAHIQDEIQTTQELRRFYSGFIARILLGQILQENNLRIISPASVPSRPFKPNLYNNVIVAWVIGLLLGLAAVTLLGQSHQREENVENN